MKSIAVSFVPPGNGRQQLAEMLGDVARVVLLPDLDAAARRSALDDATVLLTRNTGSELDEAELPHTARLSLIQFMSAGVDFVPLHRLPAGVPVAVNGGAYAEPMAEHALAMILAAAKRLLPEHQALSRGEFNQFTPTRMLRGMTAGILGFGGIGIATARLLRVLGVRVHAINRRGRSEEPVDWIGSTAQLDTLLAASDALVLSLPLTSRSERLLGARELALMKPDAILVNLARGEIVDEAALYRHLSDHPRFTACIDAWWVEPLRHGAFRMQQPFLELANVIGSPHNSASVSGWGKVALERAARNCRRVLEGEPPAHVIGDEERLYQAAGS